MRSRVLEKAPEFGEIGYGIQQGPNAYRMLDWLGVMQDLEPQAVFTKNLILIDALSGRELTRISCGEPFRNHFRAPYTVVHRRDLHCALLEACRKREEIALQTSKELAGFTDRSKNVVANVSDGSEYEGRAIIGADGLRPGAREVHMGGRRSWPKSFRAPRRTCRTCWATWARTRTGCCTTAIRGPAGRAAKSRC